MGFDLRQLEYFCALARTGSFTKAAEDLGISQPSLSEQIARLDQGFGAPLFGTAERRIELTPLGEAILGKATGTARGRRRVAGLFRAGKGRGKWSVAGGRDSDHPALLSGAIAERVYGKFSGRSIFMSAKARRWIMVQQFARWD